MGNTSPVPRLRFPGFTDAWEQRKFSEFTFNSGTRNKDNRDLEPYAVTNDRGFIPQNEAHDEFGYMQNVDRTAYNIVKPHSFAYNPARINVGSIGYYDGENDVIVSSLYEVFQTADYVDDRFLWHWLKSDNLPKWIGRLQEGSVRLYFYYDKLCECNMMIPSVDEQKKIASFLDTLDNAITLHQRKCDDLKTLKKGMLQKMFPHEGELEPEIRFPGFTGAWEQRKVGDFLTISRISGHTGVDAKKLTVKLWGKGIVEKTGIYSGSANTQYYVRRAGQFMYGKLDFLHAAFGIVPESLDGYESTLDSPAFDMNGVDGSFLLNRVCKDDFYLKYGTIANGSRKAKRIHEDTFLAMPIDIPSLEEQRQIGSFFDNFDNLITLHQRKCDELKEMKKGLLQQMFI